MTESCTAHCDLTRKVVQLKSANIIYQELPDTLKKLFFFPNHKVSGLLYIIDQFFSFFQMVFVSSGSISDLFQAKIIDLTVFN